MKYQDSELKLKHAMRLFEDAVDHHELAHNEALRAERFYHNTDCEGQWDAEDLKFLRTNKRIPLTFNLVAPKVRTFQGMYADAQRTPVVAAASSGDTLLAEVLDAVKEQLLQDADYQGLSARQLRSGVISGECSLQVEVVPSDEGPNWIKVNLYRLLAQEVLWDISSVEADRRDARYVFWFRWFDESEFKAEYPKHADLWDDLVNGIPGQESHGDVYGESEGMPSMPSDYQTDRTSRYYFDKRNGKVRVVRYEYKRTEEKRYALNLQTGERTPIENKKVQKRVDLAMSLGQPLEIVDTVEEVTEVCEFVRNRLLAEYPEAGPFKGFSIVPFCYEIDEVTGTSYGLLRNLFDPQMEFNKSKTLEQEYMAQASAPGTTAEEGSIPNVKAYERERRRPNGVAIVARGALSEGAPKVVERQITPPSPALMQRAEGALRMVDEVSGIPSQVNLTAAEHQQAGIVIALKYNKSRQTVSDPIANFERAQQRIVQMIVDTVVNVMPDDQIIAILGNREDLQIQDRQIVELAPGPEGEDGQPQMVPKRVADMQDLRAMKWRLDMEYTSENSTLRMLELDIMMQLHTAGFPVPPNIMADLASNRRSVREQLKRFAEESQRAAAAGAKAEKESLEAQTKGYIAIEAAKIEENRRHNMEQEKQEAIDAVITAQLKQLEIWEKADDNEKQRIFEVVRLVAQGRQVEQQAATNSGGMSE